MNLIVGISLQHAILAHKEQAVLSNYSVEYALVES